MKCAVYGSRRRVWRLCLVNVLMDLAKKSHCRFVEMWKEWECGEVRFAKCVNRSQLLKPVFFLVLRHKVYIWENLLFFIVVIRILPSCATFISVLSFKMNILATVLILWKAAWCVCALLYESNASETHLVPNINLTKTNFKIRFNNSEWQYQLRYDLFDLCRLSCSFDLNCN